MLSIDRLVKTYRDGSRRSEPAPGGPETDGRVTALGGVTFDVQVGELFTLLGPSGCGKTTALRATAGLEDPDSGAIRLRERVLFDSQRRVNVPANKRGFGMAFQSYAIWPHMSVYHNVAFPLEVLPRRKRPSRHAIKERVARVLEVMELSSYADRQATALSGGQQQRLALARAVVTEPPLVLLDEPLSNLDARLRESMRFELKRWQRELGLTTVYVTHDQGEALVLSSRIAVMCDGAIMQVGSPRQIYSQPANQFVAGFVGLSNFLPGVIRGSADGLTKIETREGVLWTQRSADLPAGTEAVVSVRPESIEISTESRSGKVRNEWRGIVVTRAFLGDSVDHIVAVGKSEIRVRCNPNTSIRPDKEVYLSVAPEHVIVVPQ